MFLSESIETINERLERNYGRDPVSNKPFFRVVFSEDQFEKRKGTYRDFTREGFFLREVTEVRDVPKYRQWIHEKYLLEGLTIIPAVDQEILPTEHLSYEPIWVFEDKHGNPLPPIYSACAFVLNQIRRQIEGNLGIAKYKEPELTREERLNAIEEALFGNETELTDSLKVGSAVTVPTEQVN